DQPAPRRRFQFRLRTLFVVVTVAAVVCGFAALIAENRRLLHERDEAVQQRDKILEWDRKRRLGITSMPRYWTEIERVAKSIKNQ
ncbi:MAG TPA: hypothetical protein VKB78_12020, partial [Pirellulales bacterium]|nr:hypothetical protein [Pirellulales bacterium]